MKNSQVIRFWPLWITQTKVMRKFLRHRFFRNILGTLGPKFIIYETSVGKYYCNLLEHMNVGHFFLKDGHYEPYVTQLMLEYTREPGDVLDIGANIGYFSILCSKRTGGKVYSIEPEPTNYSLLQQNINLNQSQNVISFNVAANNSSGEISFYVNSKNKGDHRCSQLDKNLSKIIKVEGKRIDQVLTKEEFNRVRVIKIDVQGYEKKVCEGMEDYLRNAKDLKIISEFVVDLMVEAGDAPIQYLQFMLDNGFNMWILDDDRCSLISASINEVLIWARDHRVSNLLFVK